MSALMNPGIVKLYTSVRAAIGAADCVRGYDCEMVLDGEKVSVKYRWGVAGVLAFDYRILIDDEVAYQTLLCEPAALAQARELYSALADADFYTRVEVRASKRREMQGVLNYVEGKLTGEGL